MNQTKPYISNCQTFSINIGNYTIQYLFYLKVTSIPEYYRCVYSWRTSTSIKLSSIVSQGPSIVRLGLQPSISTRGLWSSEHSCAKVTSLKVFNISLMYLFSFIFTTCKNHTIFSIQVNVIKFCHTYFYIKNIF